MATESVVASGPRHNLRQGEPRMELEPSGRWVRVLFNGQTVADSKRVLLVRETKNPPRYYFPREDVRTDLLISSGRGRPSSFLGDADVFTVRVGEREAVNAAWSYAEPQAAWAALAGYVAFDWAAMDAWYEEEEQVYSHPRDPYHRVDVMESSRHVKVTAQGEVVADTRRLRLLFETGIGTRYYVPREDVRMDLLEATRTTSRCPYKGQASYWKLHGGDRDIAWSYEDPLPECPKIRGLIAFYDERVDKLEVDG